EVLVPRDQRAATDAEDIWAHCLAVSYAADCLAENVPDVDRGFVTTLALLHDIGKLAILARFPEQAGTLQNISTSDAQSDELVREARLFGVDHAGLGADLAAIWKLPADLVQAIRRHHRFTDAYHVTDPLPLRKSLHIVQIANQLAKYCFPHGDRVEIDS